MTHPRPDLGPPPPLPKNGLRIVPLGGLGEIGRNMTVFEHAGQVAGRRLRRAVPGGAPARRRRDPPGLHVDPGAARRHRRDRADPRARGPHRRRAVPAEGARRHPARGIEADAGVHRRQAQGAPHHAEDPRGQGGRPRAVRPVRPRVRRGEPLDPGQPCGRDPYEGRARCSTPATSRWTSSRSTSGSPTSERSARLGEEGVDLFLVDSTNAEVPGFTVSASAISRRRSRRCSGPLPDE